MGSIFLYQNLKKNGIKTFIRNTVYFFFKEMTTLSMEEIILTNQSHTYSPHSTLYYDFIVGAMSRSVESHTD